MGKVFKKNITFVLETISELRLRRFLGLFWPLFDSIFWGQYTDGWYGPQKLNRKSAKRTRKSTEV